MSVADPRSIAAVAALMLATCGPAAAHGVGGRKIGAGQGIAVQFRYADGEDMAFAEIKVFSSGDNAAPWVVGRADRYGRYAFLPDGAGTWRVEARDGEGHVARLPVMAEDAVAPPARPVPAWAKLALWLSLTLNFALGYGGLQVWKTRQAAVPRSPRSPSLAAGA